MTSLTQNQSDVQHFTRENGQVEFIEAKPDGKHYNEAIGEYEIWLDGEVLAWASDPIKAGEQYIQALRQRNQHRQRCPADFIPFDGEPVALPEPVNEADTYGLDGRG